MISKNQFKCPTCRRVICECPVIDQKDIRAVYFGPATTPTPAFAAPEPQFSNDELIYIRSCIVFMQMQSPPKSETHTVGNNLINRINTILAGRIS